jgi:O-antigen/teichoic acid export membrane protein
LSATKIAKYTFFNFLTIGFNAFASLIVTAIIARSLGPEPMGTYHLVTWFFTMAAILVNLGFVTTTMKYMAEALGREDLREAGGTLAFGLRQIGLNGAIVTAGWLLAVPAVQRAYPQHDLGLYMGVAAAVILPSAVTALLTAALQGLQRYGQVAIATGAYTVALTAGTLLALGLQAGIGGLLVAMASANTLAAGLYLWFLHSWQPGWWREGVSAERRATLRRYSASLMVLILLDAIVWQRSGVFFLGLWAPPSEVAFYAMAFGLATMAMRMIPGTLVGLLIPSMSRSFGSGDLAQVGAIYQLAGRWMAFLALPVAVGGSALGRAITEVLYGPAFLPMADVLAVMFASGALVMVFGFPASSVLYAVEGQRFLVRVGLGTAVLNLGLAVWLIPHFGAMGAAAATAVAQVASLIPGAHYAGRMLNGTPPATRRFPATLAAAVGMGVPVWAIAQLLPPASALAVGVPVGALVYAFNLWLFRALEPEDWQRVRQVAARLPVLRRLVPARV